ncbi:tetratricopeptide repeat protein [Flavobacterium sp. NST-5]|uniref:Tetratricopeptide repeat protein n=1 Tax=Flavobacterium ichthyis TaxID=2698827 RepID=A0ABW9ZD18_9FLAO|nr:tetratricopeptide repeat protein [Flavobacterium ichthyis]NBL64980.1 tetratricopeptide repeat protein [Flavobacterium ichthyis]
MKKIFLLSALLFSSLVFAQSDQLALQYFEKGEFEKAALTYQELLQSQPGNSFYFQKLVESKQQLQQFGEAEKMLEERFAKYKQPGILVELGYNFQLQKNEAKANKYYQQALQIIAENPNHVYSVATTFEKKSLIDQALEAYILAKKTNDNYNFNFQMAVLYGQQGKTELMIETFLDEAFINQINTVLIQNQLGRFMNDDASENFNAMLRKSLLLRAQKTQDLYWNEFLSWFFVQQKEYDKAFIQEKAIYRRNPDSFSHIVGLAQIAVDENEIETANEIFSFIKENTQDRDLQIYADFNLTKAKVDLAQPKDLPTLKDEIDLLLKKYGTSPYTLQLQLLQANFYTFKLKLPEEGKNILKKTLELPLNKYQAADAKMELADILLFEEKFNQALIYYSQIEEDLKNDEMGHEASLKAAKACYFKTDFEWALKQFKELKSASTQLIANDALELFLLINDNTVADSTQVGLKKFARGDYLLYQNRNREALEQFQNILNEYKGQEIEDETLLRIGTIQEKLGDFNLALNHFQSIIEHHKDGIYVDEALYFSAKIYQEKLNDPEKAKALYEQIIFNHQDSIYFVSARKKFRQLRGDANL